MPDYPPGSFGELEQRLGTEGTLTYLAAQSIKLRQALTVARDALIDATCIVPSDHPDHHDIELALATVRSALDESEK